MSAQQHSTLDREVERLMDESKALASRLNNEIPIDEYLAISDELLQVNRQISETTNNAVHAPITVKKREAVEPDVYHVIINSEDISAGVDDHYRALCGYSFPVATSTPEVSPARAERAQLVKCQPCEDMKAQRAELHRAQQREKKALRLAQILLDRMDERGVDF